MGSLQLRAPRGRGDGEVCGGGGGEEQGGLRPDWARKREAVGNRERLLPRLRRSGGVGAGESGRSEP